MTVQDAKETLEALFSDSTGEDYPYTDKFGNALHTAIESMEKQIPKKPIFVKNDIANFYNYPNCEMIFYYGQSHCDGCGQKLDWEEGGTSD